MFNKRVGTLILAATVILFVSIFFQISLRAQVDNGTVDGITDQGNILGEDVISFPLSSQNNQSNSNSDDNSEQDNNNIQQNDSISPIFYFFGGIIVAMIGGAIYIFFRRNSINA